MKKSWKPNSLSARQLMDNILEGILVTDAEGTIKSVNPTFCSVTGYSPEEVIGKKPSLLKSGKHTKLFYKKLWDSVLTSGSWNGEICNRRKNGDLYTEWLTITTHKNSKGEITNYIAVFNDITKRKKAEKLIQHMAYYDPLTNLPNRSLFADRLKQALTQSHRTKSLLAVLFLDLDRVKIINDTLGHAMGDKLLKSVAKRLKSALRQGDTVARLGGDEFMVILPGMEHAEDIAKIAEKVLTSLRPPHYFEGHELYATASMGISIFPFDGEDPDALTKNADTAMYRAKKAGRNNYQIFTPSMKHELFEQLAMGNNLRRALDRGEFVVHYQPQITITDGKIVGMEALVRWHHPKFGLISPKKFIHWAEDSGLIIPIGEWVLKEACRQNKTWQEAGFPGLRVSVNLSARQFKQENLDKSIYKSLKETNLEPDLLSLELTESTIMEDPQTAIEVSHRIRANGIRFSIDDFGTGYSSLNYLKHFPLSNIKMDQTFVQDLASDPSDKAIAKAVIALGHGLNLSVIAEGVETESQRDLLKSYECDMMQGFFFSKPLPSNSFEQLLRKEKPFLEETLFAGEIN